ncbi:uncharacterized protein LOC114760266 [Neltuma alba]|uniref:uncharacterized protein LOC114760266 n=1 Tax=Neltuma alba TaxID=207710 RepID=UPI0010A3A3F9|nr:uncharacterized protein LOC114760266 [Prosopis alba]
MSLSPKKTESTKSTMEPESSVLSRHPSSLEGNAVLIVPEKLTGENYREWAQSVRLAVEGRGKLGYLTGEVVCPSSTNSQAVHLWKTENSMVSSWLINAMIPAIKRSFMFLPTACEIWDAVREAYSDGENVSQVFEIKTKLWQTKQGTGTLNDYYLTMSALWQELDLQNDDTWKCSEDAALYKKKVDRERLFEFLAGINSELDAVRGRLLSRVPLPTVREAFAEVRREDSRRRIMMPNPVAASSNHESSALITRHSTDNKGPKNKPICEHCKKSGHTKETCWDIHGKPADWKPKKSKGRSYMAGTERNEMQPATPAAISNDQLSKLIEMLSNLQPSGQPSRTQPTATVVHKGPVNREDDWEC